MATDLNMVALVGRLTAEPKTQNLPSGTLVAKFSIAVNRIVGRDNAKRELVNFFDLELYGNRVSSLSQYLSKGRRIAVSGSLKQDSWKDQNGQFHSRVVVVVDNVEFLDKVGSSYSNGNREQQNNPNAGNSNMRNNPQNAQNQNPQPKGDFVGDDDGVSF